MSKHCETFDHTADIGLAASADTLAELFEAIAEGLADLICPRNQVEVKETRKITVKSQDIEALAVDFLTKVMVMMQTDRFVVAAVSVPQISEMAVEAVIEGEPFDPSRHEFHTEVKAATYHQLHVVRDGERWTSRVILDI